MSSTDYIDLCGPEPSTSDYTDLHRFDKWNAWYRRFCKFFPGSNGVIDEFGYVHYDKRLKSQRTRVFKECNRSMLKSERTKQCR